MKQFLETICILDGVAQHLEYHQRRLDATLLHFYPMHHHTWLLEKCIQVPDQFQIGHVRCRVVYDAHTLDIHFFPYQLRIVRKLKLIELPDGYNYDYKYEDRKVLEELFLLKESADDILMMRHGWIMDSSIANIAFEKNRRWYTPSIPLLAGTTWKRMIQEGSLIPRPIHADDLHTFDGFILINAMMRFDASYIQKIDVV